MKTQLPQPQSDAVHATASSTPSPLPAPPPPLATAIAGSPRMTAQLRALRAAFGPHAGPAQLQGNAEPLQHGPWHVVQRTKYKWAQKGGKKQGGHWVVFESTEVKSDPPTWAGKRFGEVVDTAATGAGEPAAAVVKLGPASGKGKGAGKAARSAAAGKPAAETKKSKAEVAAETLKKFKEKQKEQDNKLLAKQVEESKGYERLRLMSRRGTNQFMRDLFGEFQVSHYTFPAQHSGDGCMGVNCISAAHAVEVKDADKPLALHINFMVETGSLQKPADEAAPAVQTLKLSLLHITARSAQNQEGIVADGASILTAARSIHCGPNNDWDWTAENANARELMTEINATESNLKAALANYGSAHVAGLRAGLKKAMVDRALATSNAQVKFEGNDSTWGA